MIININFYNKKIKLKINLKMIFIKKIYFNKIKINFKISFIKKIKFNR